MVLALYVLEREHRRHTYFATRSTARFSVIPTHGPWNQSLHSSQAIIKLCIARLQRQYRFIEVCNSVASSAIFTIRASYSSTSASNSSWSIPPSSSLARFTLLHQPRAALMPFRSIFSSSQTKPNDSPSSKSVLASWIDNFSLPEALIAALASRVHSVPFDAIDRTFWTTSHVDGNSTQPRSSSMILARLGRRSSTWNKFSAFLHHARNPLRSVTSTSKRFCWSEIIVVISKRSSSARSDMSSLQLSVCPLMIKRSKVAKCFLSNTKCWLCKYMIDCIHQQSTSSRNRASSDSGVTMHDETFDEVKKYLINEWTHPSFRLRLDSIDSWSRQFFTSKHDITISSCTFLRW